MLIAGAGERPRLLQLRRRLAERLAGLRTFRWFAVMVAVLLVVAAVAGAAAVIGRERSVEPGPPAVPVGAPTDVMLLGPIGVGRLRTMSGRVQPVPASAVVATGAGTESTLRAESARLSPDGRGLAVPRALGTGVGDPRSDLFEVVVADTGTGDSRIVPDSQGLYAGSVPVWSADRLLLFRSVPTPAVGTYLPRTGAALFCTDGSVSAHDEVAGAVDLARPAVAVTGR